MVQTREEVLKKKREYYRKNIDRCRQKQKKYQEAHSEQYNRRNKEFRTRNTKEWAKVIAERFGGFVCSKCGYQGPSIDFHHSDPSVKETTFARMRLKKPTKERLEELNKMIMLCRNCHGEEHEERTAMYIAVQEIHNA